MTPENIEQLKKDFDILEKARSKRSKMYGVIEHLGKTGRNNQVGVYQNSYHCEIQVALQYAEGGRNYWKNESLDKEFVKTISENFNSLMTQTIQRINLEYQKAQSAFDKYGLINEAKRNT